MFIWRKNHGTETPRYIVAFDTEAYHSEPAHPMGEHIYSLRLGTAIRGRWNKTHFSSEERLSFYRAEDFWLWLSDIPKSKTVTWVYAHRILFDLTMVKFQTLCEKRDIQFTLPQREKVNLKTGVITKTSPWPGMVSIDEGKVIVKCLYRGRRINFIDTMNYFPVSIEELGNELGLPKLAQPAGDSPDSEWLDYCQRDTDILWKALGGLLTEWAVNDCGNWQPTASSLAYSCYRHRFMRHAIECHNDPDVTEIERNAYHGGEVQCFFKGDVGPEPLGSFGQNTKKSQAGRPLISGPIWHLDVNSMYGYVMKEYQYPCRLSGVIVRPDIEEILKRIGTQAMVASVTLFTQRPEYPYRHEGRIIYPIGKFKTYLAGRELELAAERGDITEVGTLLVYDTADLFGEWVDYWYGRRVANKIAGNSASEKLDKAMIACLYGKFGQRYRVWVNLPGREHHEAWESWTSVNVASGDVCRFRSFGYQIQRLGPPMDASHALVSVPACVAANARAYLRQLRSTCPLQTVLYQDTDSLWVTEAGYAALADAGQVNGDALGLLKVVSVVDEAEFWGGKDYVSMGRVHKAGLPRKAIRTGLRQWEHIALEPDNALICRYGDATVRGRKVWVDGAYAPNALDYGPDGWGRPIVILAG